jgi:hypothetical protein
VDRQQHRRVEVHGLLLQRREVRLLRAVAAGLPVGRRGRRLVPPALLLVLGVLGLLRIRLRLVRLLRSRRAELRLLRVRRLRGPVPGLRRLLLLVGRSVLRLRLLRARGLLRRLARVAPLLTRTRLLRRA